MRCRTRLSRTRLSRTRLSRTRLSRTRPSRTRPTRTRLSRIRPALLLLALVGTLGGCGSTVVVGRDRVLRLAVSEYHIAPGAASVPAGRLTLLVRNFGRLSHNLAILADGHTLASTQPLPPGSQTTLTVSLRRGSYQLESTLDSDATLGATATLQVR